MANEPQILGSDVDVLDAIAAGDCDVGLTNHYYLAPRAQGGPRLPGRARLARPGGPARTRTCPASGSSRASEHRADAIRLMEFLTAREAQEAIVENGEFAANPDVPPAEHIRDWAGVKTDPIDVERAGPLARRGGRADAARRVGVARAPAGPSPRSPSRRSSSRRCWCCPRRSSARARRSTRSRPTCCPTRCARSLVLAAGVGAGHAAARRRARRARLLLRLPGPALARLGARAAAGDPGLRAGVRAARPVRRRRARRAAARAALDRRHDRRADARALPVRLRARAQRLPRPVAAGVRGGAHARVLARRPRCGGSRCRWRGRRWRAAWRSP